MNNVSDYIMPFGKYSFKSLRDIAMNYDVLYLDRLVGVKNLDPTTKEVLEKFLKISWVTKLIEDSLRSKGIKSYSEPIENIKKPKSWFEK